MKTITEKEAQELANISGCYVAASYYDRPFHTTHVKLFILEPLINVSKSGWTSSSDEESDEMYLPIQIQSEKPYTAQIWVPVA